MADTKTKVKTLEVPSLLADKAEEIVRDLAKVMTPKFAEQGQIVETGDAASGPLDIIVRDKKSGEITLIVEFKTPRKDRLAEAENTLIGIRERNQSAGERLEKLRERLALA